MAFMAAALLASCSDGKDKDYSGDFGQIKVPDTRQLEQTVTADETQAAQGVTFTTEGAWTSAITETRAEAPNWISVSPDHGDAAGTYTLKIILDSNGSEETRAAKIVVTCGSTEAMMAAMMTVANPGDKVVIFSPFYENYSADTILSGAVPIYVPLTPPSFTFDPEVLEDAFRQHPKALVLCNPSNPCGKVFTREELEIIAALAKKYDVYVITDEVYEHIIYAPHQHTYFATLPDMWERTLSCSSLSKTYSITGWRLGYIIAPPEIIDRAKKVHDFLTVGAAAPLQEAIIPGLNFGQDYYDALQAEYTHKKDLFLKGLDDLKIVHNDPEGAYYVMLDISEFGYESDLQFCEDLASKVGVGAVPGSSFFREPVNHLIRLHFAKKDETLTDALNRLESLREKIPAKG